MGHQGWLSSSSHLPCHTMRQLAKTNHVPCLEEPKLGLGSGISQMWGYYKLAAKEAGLGSKSDLFMSLMRLKFSPSLIENRSQSLEKSTHGIKTINK